MFSTGDHPRFGTSAAEIDLPLQVGSELNGREMASSLKQDESSLSRLLGYSPINDLGTARVALKARIDGSSACLGRRKPWGVQREIEALQRGATALLEEDWPDDPKAGFERLQAAAAQYNLAQRVYLGYVQKANRLLYVEGVLSSVAFLVLMAFALYSIARLLGRVEFFSTASNNIFAAADLPSMLILFGLAGLGSLVSVLTRLDKLTIPTMFSWPLVYLAGAGRPVVAAVFATVAYALLKGEIVGLGQIGRHILGSGGPGWWCVVVAFLCGYSERFASDLLGLAPFGGDGAAAAPLGVSAEAANTPEALAPARTRAIPTPRKPNSDAQ
jgi:hypothetical protein